MIVSKLKTGSQRNSNLSQTYLFLGILRSISSVPSSQTPCPERETGESQEGRHP